jgi:hypothetical protein
LRDLVRHLRSSSQLTASLALRALLSGDRDLFEAALVELSGLSEVKVAGLLRDFRGPGFAALYARAGLSAQWLPAFRAALDAQREFGSLGGRLQDARLSLTMIERVLTACEDINAGELDKLMALLRRFEMEAAREEAREATLRLVYEAEEAISFAPAIDMVALEDDILCAA